MSSGENLGAKFTLDITSLKAGLSEANALIRKSESEFIEAAAGMDDWTKSADGLAARVDSLNKQVDIQKAKIQALIDVKEKTIEQMKAEGKSDDEIAEAVDKVNVQLQKEQKQLETLQNRTDKATDELNKFNTSENEAATGADNLAENVDEAADAAQNGAGGFTVLKGVLADLVSSGIQLAINALKNFASSVIETGSQFDASMSNVAALSGATGEQLQLLENTAREFGATTQFSASEAADALGYMALAGWDANQSADALGGVLNLAAASGMELAQASDMVTDYLSAFGMAADESTYFADLLAYAQANSNTSAQQLGEAYRNCAANLNAAGQDIETVTALLGSMANQGLKGSESGTALSAMMRDLTAHMQNGAVQIGNTSVAVMDAEGNYRDLTDILADVQAATDGMGDAQRATALSATFTSDSMRGLNLILNEGVESAAEFEEGLRQSSGSAEEMAAIMNDNLAGDLKSLSSAFDELKLTIFEGANAPLRDLVQIVSGEILPSLTDMINGVEGADEAFGAAVSNLVTTALDNLTGMLEPALNIGATVLTNVVTGLLNNLPVIVSFIVGTLLPRVVQTIAQIIPQIVTAVVGLIPVLIRNLLSAAPLILQAGIDLLMNLVESLPTIISELTSQLPSLISETISTLLSLAPLLFNAAIELFMSIVESLPIIIQQLAADLPNIINTAVDALISAAPQILQAAITMFMTIVQSLPTIINSLIPALVGLVSSAASTLARNAPLILRTAVDLFMQIVNAIPQICVTLLSNMPLIISTIADGLNAGFSTIREIGSNLIQGLWNGIQDMAGWIYDQIRGFGAGVLNQLRNYFGISSPSKLMRDVIGKNLALGIGVGFSDEMATVANQMQTALNDALPAANATIGANGQVIGGNGTGGTGSVIINQTNNYSQAHSRFEIYKSRQATAAAVRAALAGG